jgi:hypothetical protein
MWLCPHTCLFVCSGQDAVSAIYTIIRTMGEGRAGAVLQYVYFLICNNDALQDKITHPSAADMTKLYHEYLLKGTRNSNWSNAFKNMKGLTSGR